MLERTDAATGATFGSAEIARLPLNGGGMLNVIELIPGANVVPATRGDPGQFTASGQRANTNLFTIDGISANTGIAAGGLPSQASGGTLPAASAFGSFDSLISVNAIDELQAQTSTPSAPIGRMPGANVGVTSQAGSNDFHSQTQVQNRENFLGSNDWFANRAGIPRPSESVNQLQQTLGGPIHRDSTFFFLSYQVMGLREAYLGTQAVPDSFSRDQAGPWAQAAVNLFPSPNQGYLAPGVAQWTGGSDEPASLQAGSLRIDRTLGSHVNFFGRYSDSPSSNDFGNISISKLNVRSQALTFGITAHPFHRLTLDGRVNESQTTVESSWSVPAAGASAACALQPLASGLGFPGPCDAPVRFTIDGIGQLVSGNEGMRRQRQFQSVASASLWLGRHSIALGGDSRRVTAIRRDVADGHDVLADSVNDLQDPKNLWTAKITAVSRIADISEDSLWIQDTWKVHPRFTLTYGLRWEFSPPPDTGGAINVYNPASGQVIKTNAPLWKTSYRDLAPRVSFAWRLTRDGKSVLRAGAGIYYDSSVSIATAVLDGGPLNVSDQFTSAVHAPFSIFFAYGFTPTLKAPTVRQWNVTMERALTAHDFLSVGYVGSSGRELIRNDVGGLGSGPNSWFALTTNNGFSNYQAFEFQYHRQFSAGLQATAAYTWSHSIDNGSTDSALQWAGVTASPNFDFGSSDFDLRQTLNASIAYEVPRGILSHWRIESIAHVRSGFPISVLESPEYTGISFANFARPNYLGGPVWVEDPSAPGGRRLDLSVFQTLPAGRQGNLGRNSIAGFGMWQLDTAIGREFRLREKLKLDVRLEAFNLFNHANFGDPQRYLNNPLFGQSTSMLNLALGTGSPGSGLAPLLQSGGPRLFQTTVRLRF
jgi:hypothetical protein